MLKLFVYTRYYTDQELVKVIAAHDEAEAIAIGRKTSMKSLRPSDDSNELIDCFYYGDGPIVLFEDLT